MRAIYVFCSIALVFCVIGCKQGDVTTESSQEQTEVADPAPTETTQRAKTNTSLGHDYTFLTHKVLLINNVVGAGEGETEPKKGDWVNLVKDGTFQAGRETKQTHTGKWSYNHDAQTLFLRPDILSYKMSEWKVMHSEQFMVWVGTQTYGNNSIQIQLLYSDQIPQ